MPKSKSKTKKCPMDTTATQEGGDWEFQTDRFEWRYGSNCWLSVRKQVPPGEVKRTWQRGIFVKNLDQAVMFAWGYDGGFDAASRLHEVEIPKAKPHDEDE